MSKRAAIGLLIAGFVALLAWAGYELLFNTFMLYDDEGYVLISLKNFAAHGALYDQVYSQYGPFFYLAYDALHRLLGMQLSRAISSLGAASGTSLDGRDSGSSPPSE